MLSFTDQTGNIITLENIPKRIISLVPSQTELLFNLGLDDEVIGITKFCIHPHTWFKTKQRVGGTKTVDIKKIKALQPDLIIANKEENVKEQIEALRQIAPVWISEISTLDAALEMIYSIGQITVKESESNSIASSIQTSFNQLLPKQPSTTNHQRTKIAYLIWRDPYMAAGGDTFIHDMLTRCGFKNILEDQPRYPKINIEQLASINCELLLLSSEPYPFKQKHIDELQDHLPNTKIVLVDGEMFSWYGSRLLFAVDYFKQLLSELNLIK